MVTMLKMVRPSQPPPARGFRPANDATASASRTETSPGIRSAISSMTCSRSAAASRASHISAGRPITLTGRRLAYSRKSDRSTKKNGRRSGLSVGKWLTTPTNCTGTARVPNFTRTC